MDLLITIKDENGDILKNLSIYQDGSDSEGADRIENLIRAVYTVEEDVPENTGYTTEEWEHGYTTFDAEGVLELQYIHDRDRFFNDKDAIEQFKQDLKNNDSFAHLCLNKLIDNHGENAGIGRNGNLHDMDFFNLWGYS